jgi:predicted transposase/invertase (TIGR01784 family)
LANPALTDGKQKHAGFATQHLPGYKLDAMNRGLAEGREVGLAEGREKGLVEGRTEARLTIARNLLKLGRPVDEVMAVTLLSREEVQSLTI